MQSNRRYHTKHIMMKLAVCWCTVHRVNRVIWSHQFMKKATIPQKSIEIRYILLSFTLQIKINRIIFKIFHQQKQSLPYTPFSRASECLVVNCVQTENTHSLSCHLIRWIYQLLKWYLKKNCHQAWIRIMLIGTGDGHRLLSLAMLMGTTWGPSGADRIQVGPMLAPWTLLSGCGSLVGQTRLMFVWIKFWD